MNEMPVELIVLLIYIIGTVPFFLLVFGRLSYINQAFSECCSVGLVFSILWPIMILYFILAFIFKFPKMLLRKLHMKLVKLGKHYENSI